MLDVRILANGLPSPYRAIFTIKQGKYNSELRKKHGDMDQVENEINRRRSEAAAIINNISTDTIKLEFPKKYVIQGLYKILQELAYDNFVSINKL